MILDNKKMSLSYGRKTVQGNDSFMLLVEVKIPKGQSRRQIYQFFN